LAAAVDAPEEPAEADGAREEAPSPAWRLAAFDTDGAPAGHAPSPPLALAPAAALMGVANALAKLRAASFAVGWVDGVASAGGGLGGKW